ncbi:multifunctional CCA addition/repair protein [Salinibius halmophilus]|uniref:multifunctional CCA addition/repair protein n=1 Tax=Salinibius halmophilus TaxID=1853216 RepID=UPI000E66E49C|nr:multifunctional CCA addition/repair protein [Salinibius halmophilus]
MQKYLVGGAVRDQLLGIAVKDKDWLVVGATPEQMLKAGFRQVGKDFPVFLHPKTNEEFALARTEKRSGSGHTGFICDFAPDVTVEQDLCRRDLTINAIALAEDGTLVDPYGGQQDLQNRVLRHVSEAFSEDPLRVFRVAQFYARFSDLGFTIAPETLNLMGKMTESGDLRSLSGERVLAELQKALNCPTPWPFFLALRQCGALKQWFPELDALFGVPQPQYYHPEVDTAVHVSMALAIACTEQLPEAVRFAVLCHDLGKGLTDPNDWPHHRGHERLGLAPINALSERLRVPKAWQKLALVVAEWHSHVHRIHDLSPETIMELLTALDVWRKPELGEQFMQACQCDYRGRSGFTNKAYQHIDLLRQLINATQQVDVQAVIADGFAGKAISEEVARRRLGVIQNLCSPT